MSSMGATFTLTSFSLFSSKYGFTLILFAFLKISSGRNLERQFPQETRTNARIVNIKESAKDQSIKSFLVSNAHARKI
jgi:hypothetical protein